MMTRINFPAGSDEPLLGTSPGPGDAGELQAADREDSHTLWKILQRMLSPREQRLAYLFFNCGLKPEEIVHFCPQEFSDVQEVYRLRRNILEQLLRHADQISLLLD